MSNDALQPRKNILRQLGFDANASRASWSHDLGESIVFDAWNNQWEKSEDGELLRYPLRTIDAGYSLRDSRENPSAGHTRWQRHVDLVLAGKRKPRAIIPVARNTSSEQSKSTKGWQPLVVDGSAQTDAQGQVWFIAARVTQLRSATRA